MSSTNFQSDRPAYFNGQWIEERDLSIGVSDPGFALGVTITERLRTFSGKLWRHAAHLDRMRRSAEIVGIAPAVINELDQALSEFESKINDLRSEGEDWWVAIFATPGLAGEPTRCIHGAPLRFVDWAHQYSEGVRLRTSEHRQTPPNCWPAELKCRSRMHYYLADQQAMQQEPGARALLLDQEGYVGEASTANLVIYNEGEGIISPRMEKVLPGVSVAVLKELAESNGIAFVERDLTLDEFRNADEAWLSSTSVCLLPVSALDGVPIGQQTPGPMYQRMLAAWNGVVGLDIAKQAVDGAKS